VSGREALAARIREQAIETTGRMPCVKSDRGGAVGTSPDLLRSQSCDVRAHLFAALQQAVGNGLQQRRHGGNRATKPHLRRRHGRENWIAATTGASSERLNVCARICVRILRCQPHHQEGRSAGFFSPFVRLAARPCRPRIGMGASGNACADERVRPGSRQPFAAYSRARCSVRVRSIDDIVAWLQTCEYVSDFTLFHKQDFWQHPAAFEKLRRGDCEDFALWAWRKLAELGIDAEFCVGRVICGDQPEIDRQHAWVVYRVNGTEVSFRAQPPDAIENDSPLADAMGDVRAALAVNTGSIPARCGWRPTRIAAVLSRHDPTAPLTCRRSFHAAKPFLVTGGSQGIGAAIVELACRAGHQVVFTGRNEQLIETSHGDGSAWTSSRRIGGRRQCQNRRGGPGLDEWGRRPRSTTPRTLTGEIGALDIDERRGCSIPRLRPCRHHDRIVPLMKSQGSGDIVNIANRTPGMKGAATALLWSQQVAVEASASAGRRSETARYPGHMCLPFGVQTKFWRQGRSQTIRTNCTPRTSAKRFMAALNMPRRCVVAGACGVCQQPVKGDSVAALRLDRFGRHNLRAG